MIGTFINRNGEEVVIEVSGGNNSPLTIVSAKIESTGEDIFKPIKYTSFSFSVFTDNNNLYKGLFLNQTVTVTKENVIIWTGKIIELPKDQPFNYESEVLEFTAVDELTLLKSELINRKGRAKIKDYILECIGNFYYIPFLSLENSTGLLDAEFSYQAYIEDESSVVYKSEILESVLSYLGVCLARYNGNYYIYSPSFTSQSICYAVSQEETQSVGIVREVVNISGSNIAKAEVKCSWNLPVNSITLTCDYIQAGSSNADETVKDETNYWLSDNYEFNYSLEEPIQNDENEGEIKLGVHTVSYPKGWSSQQQTYYPYQMHNLYFYNQNKYGDYIAPANVIDFTLLRYGFSPNVTYFTYYKPNTNAALVTPVLAETATGEEVLSSIITNLTFPYTMTDKEKKLYTIQCANGDFVNNGGLYGCCELSYDYNEQNSENLVGVPKGSPNFKSSILVYGTNGINNIYLFDDFIDKVPICTRHYNISPTQLVNSSLRQHYIVFAGSLKFLTNNFQQGQWEAEFSGKCTMLVNMQFVDDEDNVIKTEQKKLEFSLEKGQDMFSGWNTTNNVTWLTGINESGFAIALGDIGRATKLNLTIYGIDQPKIEFGSGMYGSDYPTYNLQGVSKRTTDRIPIDQYLLDISAKIATGFVEGETPAETIPSNEDAQNQTNTVYYWQSEECLTGGKDLDISNKLCTYDGKMSTFSSPTYNGDFLGKVNCNFYAGNYVSEVFRFGELIDQYKTPTIGFNVPLDGLGSYLAIYKYNYVNSSNYIAKSISYDCVTDQSVISIEELKPLTEVQLV